METLTNENTNIKLKISEKNSLTFSFFTGKVRALNNRQGALLMKKTTCYLKPYTNAPAAIILLIKP